MFKFRKSLGFRIFALSIILLILPLFIDSFILLYREREGAIQDAKNYLIEVANLRDLELTNVAPISNHFINVLEEALQLKEKFPKEVNTTLTQELENWSNKGKIYGIFIVATENDQHKIVGSNLPSFLGNNLESVMIIKDLNLEKNFSSQVAFNRETGTPFFFITKSIKDPKTSKVIGFILITDLLNLTEKLEKLLVTEKGIYPINFAFLDENGFVIAASDSSMELHYFNPLSKEKIKGILSKHFLENEKLDVENLTHPIEMIPGEVDPPLFAFQWHDKTQIGYIKTIPDFQYSLLAYASRDEIITNPMGNHLNVYGGYLAILLIGSVLSFFIVKRMAKPINDLTKVMQSIQEGKFDVRYKKDPLGFEINNLGMIFNKMLDSLIENQSKAGIERVKKESYLQELRLGRQAQMSLLPQKMPKIEGIEIAERYIPAIEVGGDFYDVFVLNKDGDKRVYLIIADASGKGVQACFYSLSARSMIRTYAKLFDKIDTVMHATNALFCNDVGETGMFITVAAAIYHIETGELEYYSSGHNPGFIRRKDGTLETLHLQDIAMGLLLDSKSQAKKVKLEKGDLLLFYTDGVTEAHDKELKLFGENRLKAFLQSHDISAHEMVDQLIEEVNNFANGRLQHDDITLLAMKIREEGDEEIICT